MAEELRLKGLLERVQKLEELSGYSSKNAATDQLNAQEKLNELSSRLSKLQSAHGDKPVIQR